MGSDGSWFVRAGGKGKGQSPSGPGSPSPDPARRVDPPSEPAETDPYELGPGVAHVGGYAERTIFENDARETREKGREAVWARRKRRQALGLIVLLLVLLVGSTRLVLGPDWLQRIGTSIRQVTGMEQPETKNEPVAKRTPAKVPESMPPPKSPKGL